MFNFRFNPKYLWTNILDFYKKSWVILSSLFISLYFFIASYYYYSGFNNTLALCALLFLVPLQLISIVNFFKSTLSFSKSVSFIARLFTIGLLIVQFLGFVLLLKGNPLDQEVLYFSIIMATGLSMAIFHSLHYIKLGLNRIKLGKRNNWIVYLLAITYIFGFLFLVHPLLVYLSFPNDFNFYAIDIVYNNIKYFFLAIFGMLILYGILPKNFNRIYLTFIVAVSFIFFINSTILPIDLGWLEANKFSDQEMLAAPIYLYFIEGSLLLIIFYAVSLLIEPMRRNYLLGVQVVIICGLLIQGIVSLIDSHNLKKEFVISSGQHQIQFSENKENIVFVIPDAFEGWSMNKVLNDSPECAFDFDGFSWYSNALSISNSTNASILPLIGGWDYAPDKMNLDDTKTNSEKFEESYREIFNRIKEKGWQLTSTKLPYLNSTKTLVDNYLPAWHPQWNDYNEAINISELQETSFSLLNANAFFLCSPLCLKPRIYNKGDWLIRNNKENRENQNNWINSKYHFIRLLSKISVVKRTDQANFILIYSLAPHFPWNKVSDRGVVENALPRENNAWFIKELSTWFVWMKENNVYDNTKIFVVSDHGVNWTRHYKDMRFDDLTLEEDGGIVDDKTILHHNPVLLIKDFHSSGTITKKDDFISNADVNSIIFEAENISNTTSIFHEELMTFASPWIKGFEKQKTLPITHSYIVKNDIFIPKNWTLITK